MEYGILRRFAVRVLSSLGRCLAALPAFAMAGMVALGGLAHAADGERYGKALRSLRDSIRTIQMLEDLRIEDRRPGGETIVTERTARLTWSRSAGRLRVDLISPQNVPERRPLRAGNGGDNSKPGRETIVVTAAAPEPAWLFGLADVLINGKVRERRKGKQVELDIRHPRQQGAGPARTIILGGNGLPVLVRTYGVRGEVLDEAEIKWAMAGGRPFPSSITVIQRSRTNTLVKTARYREIGVDFPVSASFFGSP